MKHSIIRLLGILLSLVLMLGLMSGMGLTVYAEPTGTGIDGQNNKTNENSTLREESAQTTRPLNAEEQVILEEEKAKVRAQYGENRKITDEQYDKSLAVKCVNGTFVGRYRLQGHSLRGKAARGRIPLEGAGGV